MIAFLNCLASLVLLFLSVHMQDKHFILELKALAPPLIFLTLTHTSHTHPFFSAMKLQRQNFEVKTKSPGVDVENKLQLSLWFGP